MRWWRASQYTQQEPRSASSHKNGSFAIGLCTAVLACLEANIHSGSLQGEASRHAVFDAGVVVGVDHRHRNRGHQGEDEEDGKHLAACHFVVRHLTPSYDLQIRSWSEFGFRTMVYIGSDQVQPWTCWMDGREFWDFASVCESPLAGKLVILSASTSFKSNGVLSTHLYLANFGLHI